MGVSYASFRKDARDENLYSKYRRPTRIHEQHRRNSIPDRTGQRLRALDGSVRPESHLGLFEALYGAVMRLYCTDTEQKNVERLSVD